MAWVSTEVHPSVSTHLSRAFLLTSEGLREEDAADVPWLLPVAMVNMIGQSLPAYPSNPIPIERVNDDESDIIG
jgi:hypothetical protein